jgi:hypothetical protein
VAEVLAVAALRSSTAYGGDISVRPKLFDDEPLILWKELHSRCSINMAEVEDN